MKKVMLDTNILVSAVLDSESNLYQAYKKAVEPPYQSFICDQNIEELRRVFKRKFPGKTVALENFIESAQSVVKIIPVPLSTLPDEEQVRDPDDRPILRAAIKAGVDILITGDKDFLESGLTTPRIITASEFLKMP